MIAVDGSGVVHVVYHTPDNYTVFYTRTKDGGASWSSPFQLSTDTLIAHGPNIAVGPDNRLHVAWVNGVSGDPTHIFYRRFVPGSGWDPTPTDISGTLAYDAQTPSISVDLEGRVHVVWHIGVEDSLPSVYYTRSSAGGASFVTPQQISSTDTTVHAAWPRFSVQGTTGDIVAVPWRDIRSTDSTGNVYVAVSTDTGQTFTEYEVPTFAGANELDPTAMVDADGVIHLLYTQEITIIGKAKYQRSTDLGVSWTSEHALTTEPSRFSWWAYDYWSDMLWVLWKDERDGVPGNEKSDLMATYSADGGLTWGTNEFVTDLGDLDARFPAIAIGQDSRLHAIWSDLRHGDTLSTMFMRQRDPVLVGVAKDTRPPRPFVLHSAVPNPFGARTVIRYELSKRTDVRIDVYDVAGRLVRTLVDTRGRPAGSFEAIWDGRDSGGYRVASGVYFYRIVAAGLHETRKMAILR